MDKKALVVLTNVGQYGEDPEPTGMWLAEATEFVYKMQKAGIEIDYVSPKGGKVPVDPRSMKFPYASKMDYHIYNSIDFKMRALVNSLKPSDINPNDYFVIYYTGGHGTLWDYPKNLELQAIAEKIYANGGYITSVCHGVVGLLNIKNAIDQHIIAGRNITGFTDEEEVVGGRVKKVPYSAEQEARYRGANFIKTLPFTPNAVKSGRVITGQNPFSGRAVARKLLEDINI